MKRVPLLTIPVTLVFAVLAVAHDTAIGEPSANQRQLQRNRSLIRDLVQSGLQLAAEEDPLVRADHCHALAERVIDEIKSSASESELDRAVQLSEHLNSVLKLGIASNLRIVRFESSPSSTREIDVQRVGSQVRDLMEPLEEFLRGHGADGAELRRALRGIRDGQAEVEKVIQVRTPR
jgi:hypothetical protein